MGHMSINAAKKSADSNGFSLRRPGKFFTALLAGLAILGCTRTSLVATYTGGEITRSRYESYLQFADLLDSPSAIREMILVEYLSDLALKMGLEEAPETKVELVIETQRILGEKLRNHVFLSATATDAEIKVFADQNPLAFQRPRKMKLRQIYKEARVHPEAVRQDLEGLRTAVQGGASFEELAMRESESQSRFSGGRLGFVDPNTLPKAVASAISPLGEGEISEVVPTGHGFSIFLCQKVQESVVPTRAEVEAKIRKNLLRSRGKEDWKALTESLRAKVKLKFPLELEHGVYQVHNQAMTPEELDALKALQMAQKGWDTMVPGQVYAVLQNWCLGKEMADRARELGLDKELETANNLYWQRRKTLATKVMDQRMEKRLVSPTEAEIEAFYTENRDRLTTPPAFRVAAIFLGDGNAAAEMATKVNQELESGKITFAAAAQRYSLHESAKDGGLLDWMLARELSAYGIGLSRAIRHMKPAERTGVFRLDSGFWIFELVDVKESRELTLDEARFQVENALHRRHLEETELALHREILAELKVEIIGESEGS